MISVLVIACLFGYLCGSVPFGLIVTKMAGMGDIRKVGSGNIGATNVLRTGNKKIAALVLLLDLVKGLVPVLFIKLFLDTLFEHFPHFGLEAILSMFVNPPNVVAEVGRMMGTMLAPAFAGVFAIFGHMFPVWLKFKGGKGVATTIGFYLGLSWPVGLLIIACWLAVFAVSRYSSLSALIAIGIAAPLYYLVTHGPYPGLESFALGLLVTYKHRENIKRLLKGEESRFGRK